MYYITCSSGKKCITRLLRITYILLVYYIKLLVCYKKIIFIWSNLILFFMHGQPTCWTLTGKWVELHVSSQQALPKDTVAHPQLQRRNWQHSFVDMTLWHAADSSGLTGHAICAARMVSKWSCRLESETPFWLKYRPNNCHHSCGDWSSWFYQLLRMQGNDLVEIAEMDSVGC